MPMLYHLITPDSCSEVKVDQHPPSKQLGEAVVMCELAEAINMVDGEGFHDLLNYITIT